MKLMIQIPCLDEEETLPATLRDIPKQIDGIDEIEILIIDDDPVVRKIARTALKKAGHTSFECSNGADGLKTVRERKLDLVLMDVDLGDSDGREICRELRGKPSSNDLPIILISGAQVEPDDQVRGLREGADDVEQKCLGHREPELLAQLEVHPPVPKRVAAFSAVPLRPFAEGDHAAWESSALNSSFVFPRVTKNS